MTPSTRTTQFVIATVCLLALAGFAVLLTATRVLGAATPVQPGWQTIPSTLGGSVVARDGRARLVIPPHALTADTAIGVQPLGPGELAAGWPFNSSLLGAARFEPHGLVFSRPVTATFTLLHPQPPGKALDLFYHQEADHKYNYQGPKAIVDPDGMTASAQIDHFSTYLVSEPPADGYPVLVVVRLALNDAPVIQAGPGNPHVVVTAFEQSVNAVDGGGGLYVAFLQLGDLPLLASQGGQASAVYSASGAGDSGPVQYAGGTQWAPGAWSIVGNPAAPLEQVAGALAGQLANLATATQIGGALSTVLGDAVWSQAYLLIATATQIDLHPVDQIQPAQAELQAQLSQLLALRQVLIANNCPNIPSEVQIAWEAALQAQQSGNPQQIQTALQWIALARAAVASYLAHPFAPGVNPAGANPGETVAITGVPANHKCPGAALSYTVHSTAGNAGPLAQQLTIARPKRAGRYPVQIGVRESILGIETQGGTQVEVFNVAPRVVASADASGLPGETVTFRNRVQDDNAELSTEITPMPLSGSALEALEDIQVKFVTAPGGGTLTVRGRIKDPQADGPYVLNVQFRDQGGLVSNVMPDNLSVGNVAPVLVSLRITPQAVQPSTEIPVMVQVRLIFSDRNGLADIRKVTITLQPAGVVVAPANPPPFVNPAINEVVFNFQALGTSGSVTVIARVEDEAASDAQQKTLPVANLPPGATISACTSQAFDNTMIFGVVVYDPNGDPVTAQFQAGPQTYPVNWTSTPTGATSFIRIISPPPPPGTTPLRFLVTAGGQTVAVECANTGSIPQPPASQIPASPTPTNTPTPTQTPTPTATPPHPDQPYPLPGEGAPVETTSPRPGEKP